MIAPCSSVAASSVASSGGGAWIMSPCTSASSIGTPSQTVISRSERSASHYAFAAGALAPMIGTGVTPSCCTWYTVRDGKAKLDPWSLMMRMNVISMS